MNDLFSDRAAQPMLIGAEGEAFDSPDYLFELKLDGERCLCYLDPKSGSDLRNKKTKGCSLSFRSFPQSTRRSPAGAFSTAS